MKWFKYNTSATNINIYLKIDRKWLKNSIFHINLSVRSTSMILFTKSEARLNNVIIYL